MTTIGSTTYYTSDIRYSGSEKMESKSNDANAVSPQTQDTKTSSGSSDTYIDSRPSAATANFQGRLLTLNPIAGSNLKSTPLWEMPGSVYERVASTREMLLEAKYTQFPEAPDLSNYAGIKSYADVVVGGKVVATIDNQGVVGTLDNKLSEKLRGLSEKWTGTAGPDMAQNLAEQIAGLLGGRVVKSDTALTQAEYNALPTVENPKPWVDYDAMRVDPEYNQIQELKQKRAEYLASQQTSGT